MSEKDDGGPAFPADEVIGFDMNTDEPIKEARAGMSMRDYFAAKFMQGFVAAPDRETEYSHVTKDECAKRAYQMADAMLAARLQDGKKSQINAALHDAAPDLLAACQEMTRYAPGEYMNDPRSDYEIDSDKAAAFMQMRAAIAKATGSAA